MNTARCSESVSSIATSRRLWEVVAHRRAVVVYPQMLAAGVGSPASRSSGDPFTAACGTSNPGIACRLVWDLTHSTKAANLTMVYFAGPIHLVIRVGFVVLIALIIRVAPHRAIRKVTARPSKASPTDTHLTYPLLLPPRPHQTANAPH